MEYKEALKRGLYDFEIARNWYRSVCSPDNGGPAMHRNLVFSFIRNNALLIAPFTPHFSEHIWQNILGEKSTVQSAPFPKPSGPVDPIILQQLDYMRGTVDSLRGAEALLLRKKGKGKGNTQTFDPSKAKYARIYVATEYPEWQNKCVGMVKAAWDERTNGIDEAKLRKELDAAGLSKDKRSMPFCQTFKVKSAPCFTLDETDDFVQRKVLEVGMPGFSRSLPFSELDVLRLLLPYLRASLKYQECSVVSVEEARQEIKDRGDREGWSKAKAEDSEPGSPAVLFWNA